MGNVAKLDELERVAVQAISRTYDVRGGDRTERFWIQKGIEGMRYAIAQLWEDEDNERANRRKPHTIYVHGGSDELSDLWPPDAPQQEKYHYVGYEIEISGEVDMDTGEFYAQSVQNVPLKHEVSV